MSATLRLTSTSTHGASPTPLRPCRGVITSPLFLNFQSIMSKYENKLPLNAGETATVEVHHADGYKKDVHSVEYNQKNGVIKVVVM